MLLLLLWVNAPVLLHLEYVMPLWRSTSYSRPENRRPLQLPEVQQGRMVNLLVGCAEHLPQRLRIDGFVANHPQINTIQRLAFLLCNLGFPRMLQTQTVSKGKLLLTLS